MVYILSKNGQPLMSTERYGKECMQMYRLPMDISLKTHALARVWRNHIAWMHYA